MLEINEYQKKAHETADYPTGIIYDNKSTKSCLADYIYPALGLAEEAGEVAGKYAKAVRDCSGGIDRERKEYIVKELGDVCWFVAELATLLDVSLEEIMQKNLDKLASRKERNVIHGNGDNR